VTTYKDPLNNDPNKIGQDTTNDPFNPGGCKPTTRDKLGAPDNVCNSPGESVIDGMIRVGRVKTSDDMTDPTDDSYAHPDHRNRPPEQFEISRFPVKKNQPGSPEGYGLKTPCSPSQCTFTDDDFDDSAEKYCRIASASGNDPPTYDDARYDKLTGLFTIDGASSLVGALITTAEQKITAWTPECRVIDPGNNGMVGCYRYRFAGLWRADDVNVL
jgi:hypothetical protein